MPRKKTTLGLPKSISCPWCGKKFCTATNVLQHMNQPRSSCYHESLAEEMSLITTNNHTEVLVDRFSMEEVDVPDGVDDDEDIDMAIPKSPAADDDEDIEMTVPQSPAAHNNIPFPPSDPPDESQHGQFPGIERFVETYEGCAKVFPGGETFIDWFRNDQYVEQQ